MDSLDRNLIQIIKGSVTHLQVLNISIKMFL